MQRQTRRTDNRQCDNRKHQAVKHNLNWGKRNQQNLGGYESDAPNENGEDCGEMSQKLFL
jgi:hypothetical protein